MTPERIKQLSKDYALPSQEEFYAAFTLEQIESFHSFAQAILKERDEQKDAEIAQLREQLAAYEAEPILFVSSENIEAIKLGLGGECPAYSNEQDWAHVRLIPAPTSTANLEAIKQEARDKALEEAREICQLERLSGFTSDPTDIAYNTAIDHCVQSLSRAMKGGK